MILLDSSVTNDISEWLTQTYIYIYNCIKLKHCSDNTPKLSSTNFS